jgi:hypothetical protein
MKQVGDTLCPTNVTEMSDEDENVAESFPDSCSRVCFLHGKHIVKQTGLTMSVQGLGYGPGNRVIRI